MRVKPASAEVKVRDPATRRHLPAEGAEVADTAFWRRRLAEGDVVLIPSDMPWQVELGVAAPTPAKRRSSVPAEAKE